MPTYSNTVSQVSSGKAGNLRNVSRVTKYFRPDAKHIYPRGSTGKDADAPFGWRQNVSDSQKQEWKEGVDKWHDSEKNGKIKHVRPVARGESKASKKRKRAKAKQLGNTQQAAPDTPDEGHDSSTQMEMQDDGDDDDFFKVKAQQEPKQQAQKKKRPQKLTKAARSKNKTKKKQNKRDDDMEMEDMMDGTEGFNEDDDLMGGAFSSLSDLAALSDLNASTTKSFITKIKEKKNMKVVKDPQVMIDFKKTLERRKGKKEKKLKVRKIVYSANDFVAAKSFEGTKSGFVFKMDSLGVGYYKDHDQQAATTAAKKGEEEVVVVSKKSAASNNKDKDKAAKIPKPNPPADLARRGGAKAPQMTKAQQKEHQKAVEVELKAAKKQRKVKMKAVDLGGGLLVQDTLVGTGKFSAVKGATVKILYTGSILSTGKKFDSCQNPNKPFTFQLGRGTVVAGMEIGLKGLKAGGKRIIVIPPELGYGKQVLKRIPLNSTLKFKIELLEVGPPQQQ